MSRIIDTKFVYGAQYYRAPTPLPDEWEHDMAKMQEAGIDTVQLRVQWRKNEPREDEYYFDDLDKLFELAEKHKRKVIFKFLMENAPDYIYEKYEGQRKDMNGLPLNPGANGAFYIGGWLPCFDNPDVVRRAEKFVKVMVKRYKNKENLLLWNVWNEPRSRPIGECGCKHSIKSYRKWLSEQYDSITAFNDEFGKGWASFDTVRPPAMPHDYTDLYLWRRWSLSAVTDRLKFMYKAVKNIDDSRPVISHVGNCSIIQDIAGDGSDDLANAEAMDFYGTSFPVGDTFDTKMSQAMPLLISDWLRSVSEYYWVYELYPDWGDWGKKISIENFRYKVFGALACGAKGILYWQYRAERLGYENNLAGLVNIDGSFKAISFESAKISEFIKNNEDFLLRAKVKEDGIGIVYSQESDMINRVENTGNGIFWDFALHEEQQYSYKKSLVGSYMMFRELGYAPSWIDARKLGECLKDIKVLYLPECFIISDEDLQTIKDFTAAGGLVIAEEGLALRQANTWLNQTWPSKTASRLFGTGITERISTRKGEDAMNIAGRNIPAGEYISYLENTGSEEIADWRDGRCAAVKKGNSCFIGTGFAASYYDNHETQNADYLEVLQRLISGHIKPPELTLPGDIYLRELETEDEKMLFVFNRSDKEQDIKYDGQSFKLKAKESTGFRYYK